MRLALIYEADLSRRHFLGLVGGAAACAATGCANPQRQLAKLSAIEHTAPSELTPSQRKKLEKLKAQEAKRIANEPPRTGTTFTLDPDHPIEMEPEAWKREQERQLKRAMETQWDDPDLDAMYKAFLKYLQKKGIKLPVTRQVWQSEVEEFAKTLNQ